MTSGFTKLLLSGLLLAGTAVADSTNMPSAVTDITSYDPEQALLIERGEKHSEVIYLLEKKRFIDATEPAAAVVRITREIYGPDSSELNMPLLNLANIQRRTNDHENAWANYSELIRIVERNETIMSARLIEPLTGLGKIYNLNGEYILAERALTRALSINHANLGFYNTQQEEIRGELTEAWAEQGELTKANFQQQRIVALYQYEHGEKSPRTVPALFRLANWYGSTGQARSELFTYRKAYKILEKEEGKNNPELIDALRFIARSYLAQPGARGEALLNARNYEAAFNTTETDEPSSADVRNGAVTALKRALAINEAQETPDSLLQAQLHLDLGDTYTLFGSPDSGRKQYSKALENFATQEDAATLIAEAFSRPKRIGYFDLPDVYPDSNASRNRLTINPDSFENGYILTAFTVKKNGTIKDIEIIKAEPDGLLNRKVKRGLSYGRYRPAFIEGKPVSSTDVRYRYEFKYERPTEQDDESEPLPDPNKTEDLAVTADFDGVPPAPRGSAA